MAGTLIDRQQIIDTIGTLPSETLVELTHFLEYLRYKSLQSANISDSKLSQTIVKNQSKLGLQEKDGILVFETEPLDNINFTDLIEQSRNERILEQFGL